MRLWVETSATDNYGASLLNYGAILLNIRFSAPPAAACLLTSFSKLAP